LAAVGCLIDFANGQAITHDDGTTYFERAEDAFSGMQRAEPAAAMVHTLECSHAQCSDRAHFHSFDLGIQSFKCVQ